MLATEILLALIKDSEGCSLVSYQCPAGVWTIGWGHTGKEVTKDLVWTQQQADESLREEASKCLKRAIDASPTLSDCNKQAAIADFIYNLGIGNYRSSTLKKRVDVRDWVLASYEIKRWNKAGGKVLRGLTIRREKEAELLLK